MPRQRIFGDTLILQNSCRMACNYCGYLQGEVVNVDLDHLAAQARALPTLGRTRVCLTGSDPAEHPQFVKVLEVLLNAGLDVTVTTPGLVLHAAVAAGEWWATDQRIRWSIPFLSADPTLHDRLVGRPGHHALVMDLMRDKRLQVYLNVLLVRDVLLQPDFEGLLCLIHGMDRVCLPFIFTPRVKPPKYYFDNVPTYRELWGGEEGRSGVMQFLPEFAERCAESVPLCTVPGSLQAGALQRSVSRLNPRATATIDVSLMALEPCPREHECPAGPACMGVFSLYRQRYGTDEFQPSRITSAAAAMLDPPSAEGLRAVKSWVRGKYAVDQALEQSDLPKALDALAALARQPDVLLRHGQLTLEALEHRIAAAYPNWVRGLFVAGRRAEAFAELDGRNSPCTVGILGDAISKTWELLGDECLRRKDWIGLHDICTRRYNGTPSTERWNKLLKIAEVGLQSGG